MDYAIMNTYVRDCPKGFFCKDLRDHYKKKIIFVTSKIANQYEECALGILSKMRLERDNKQPCQ
jgi:hypothetical protein